jgi:hypothetical protein
MLARVRWWWRVQGRIAAGKRLCRWDAPPGVHDHADENPSQLHPRTLTRLALACTARLMVLLRGLFGLPLPSLSVASHRLQKRRKNAEVRGLKCELQCLLAGFGLSSEQR